MTKCVLSKFGQQRIHCSAHYPGSHSEPMTQQTTKAINGKMAGAPGLKKMTPDGMEFRQANWAKVAEGKFFFHTLSKDSSKNNIFHSLGILIPSLAAVAKKGHYVARRGPKAPHQTCEGPSGHRI